MMESRRCLIIMATVAFMWGVVINDRVVVVLSQQPPPPPRRPPPPPPQGGAPPQQGQGVGCRNVLNSLWPCIPYVVVSNASLPQTPKIAGCCDPLVAILQSTTNVTCLCRLPNLAKSHKIDINLNSTLNLVLACNFSSASVPTSIKSCLGFSE